MGRKSKAKKRQSRPISNRDQRQKTSAPFSWKNWLFVAALAAAVFLAYRPTWHGDFIWDDDLHLLDNPVLKSGGLASTWTPHIYINYWPVTFTVYRLEFEAWGLNPLGFHLVNIALHAVSALLVWRLLVELAVPGAMLAAAIFALHPVNVESVAWIAQLKGILSLLFALVSSLFYLQYDRRGGWRRYLISIAAFSLSALSKGMMLTLPAVLLACVWWRRGAIAWRDVARVVPFLVIGALMSVLEVGAQQVGEGGQSSRSDDLAGRFAVAGCAVWFYLEKLLWPLNFSFVYSRWKIDAGNVLWYVPLLMLVIIFALAFWRRRTWGKPVVLLIVCYVSLLLPALGFVNIYFMRYSLVADHYQYAAMIVPCAVLVGGAAARMYRRPGWQVPAYALSFLLLATMLGLTWRQSKNYTDVDTIFRATIVQNPDCWLAHNNLAKSLLDHDQFDQAIEHCRKAIELKPDHEDAHNNLGIAVARRYGLERLDEAIEHFRDAIQIRPNYAEAHLNLGNALAMRKQFDEAIEEFRKALALKPHYPDASNNLAVARRDRAEEAVIAPYRKQVEIKPDSIDARIKLGDVLARHKKVNEAIECYREALELAVANNVWEKINKLHP